jgi:TetR/AcrR family transcriptional regulator, transcriptional repressor of bet genes
MAAKRHVPKFHRATPAVRREALVDATLRCLKQHGHEGVSVRRISAAAGVSIGLINHHFPSKSGLIAETYETLALSLLDSIRRQAENKAVSPRDRLSNFFRASFAPEILDPQLFNVWLVFWSMVAHSAEIRAVHFSTYAKYRAVLESLLAQLVDTNAAPPFRLRPAAIALSALLDGFWIELSLSPTVFKPREAIAHCEDWVNALCRGDFPRLLSTPKGRKPGAPAKRRRT